jgi:hypothetical protein
MPRSRCSLQLRLLAPQLFTLGFCLPALALAAWHGRAAIVAVAGVTTVLGLAFALAPYERWLATRLFR